LLIVGDGEEMPAVREAVRELRAEDFIQILGRVPHDDIERYYSVVDVLVYPRHSIRLTELVTPLKPLEAMALAKPSSEAMWAGFANWCSRKRPASCLVLIMLRISANRPKGSCHKLVCNAN